MKRGVAVAVRSARRAAITALLSGAAIAHAAIYTVTANPDMTFTPADITIFAGDTIAFENAGGVHNVRADNDAFWCSINCTTDRAPSATLWRATVRFAHPGTFGYYCEAHGDLGGGMRGSITVIDRVFVDGFEEGPP